MRCRYDHMAGMQERKQAEHQRARMYAERECAFEPTVEYSAVLPAAQRRSIALRYCRYAARSKAVRRCATVLWLTYRCPVESMDAAMDRVRTARHGMARQVPACARAARVYQLLRAPPRHPTARRRAAAGAVPGLPACSLPAEHSMLYCGQAGYRAPSASQE
jgi:hypothetical protein